LHLGLCTCTWPPLASAGARKAAFRESICPLQKAARSANFHCIEHQCCNGKCHFRVAVHLPTTLCTFPLRWCAAQSQRPVLPPTDQARHQEAAMQQHNLVGPVRRRPAWCSVVSRLTGPQRNYPVACCHAPLPWSDYDGSCIHCERMCRWEFDKQVCRCRCSIEMRERLKTETNRINLGLVQLREPPFSKRQNLS
jgi:hypothetical protein